MKLLSLPTSKDLKRNWLYARYLIKHKWFVCYYLWFKMKKFMPYYLWRGLIHDWSKFTPLEWKAYANFFYGERLSKDEILERNRREINLFGMPITKDPRIAFNYAWLNHQRVNKHHWQYWVLLQDSGELIPLKIPEKYVWELIADWKSAGRCINGKEDAAGFFIKNCPSVFSKYIHKDTLLVMMAFLLIDENEGNVLPKQA